MFRLLMRLAVMGLILQVVPAPAWAQYPSQMQGRLERAAAERPAVAEALAAIAAARDASSYSKQEFRDSLRIEWLHYLVGADGQSIEGVVARGEGDVGSVLGASVDWVDGQRYMSYEATSYFDDQRGLVLSVTVRPPDADPVTTEYEITGLEPVAVVLLELEDGSKHVARFVPELEPKRQVLDYGDELRMTLDSAVLIADDVYGGAFSASGSIVGVTSGALDMRFEFGLKAFADALPIGRTDGRTIWFDYEGVEYKLANGGPLTALGADGTNWTVYVRGEHQEAVGNGAHAKSYHAELLQRVLQESGNR